MKKSLLRNLKHVFVLALSITLITGCVSNKENIISSENDAFQITAPSDYTMNQIKVANAQLDQVIKEAGSENKKDDFQIVYSNKNKDRYVAVRQGKADGKDLETLHAEYVTFLNKEFSNNNADNIEVLDTEVNGKKAKSFSISEEIQTVKFKYLITETVIKDKYYIILQWTYEKDFEKCEESFKEIQNSFKLK